jgi:hypothetical protein
LGACARLLVFVRYVLSADLRQLRVQCEATLMRPGDKPETSAYRNRFVYDSPELPVPAKPVDRGVEQTAWERDELAELLLGRWTKHDGTLLKEEVKRASTVCAGDMAMDLMGKL